MEILSNDLIDKLKVEDYVLFIFNRERLPFHTPDFGKQHGKLFDGMIGVLSKIQL